MPCCCHQMVCMKNARHLWMHECNRFGQPAATGCVQRGRAHLVHLQEQVLPDGGRLREAGHEGARLAVLRNHALKVPALCGRPGLQSVDTCWLAFKGRPAFQEADEVEGCNSRP